jgi:chemotaxis signal transduction protein
MDESTTLTQSQHEAATPETLQFLAFTLGDEEYGVTTQ